MEKSSKLGGVWRWYGNPFSRVNSSEPGYRLPLGRAVPATNHSYCHEVMTAQPDPFPNLS